MVDEKQIRSEVIPVVRITMDSMKMSIMNMLNPVLIKQAIEQRLDDAIKGFDFDSVVKAEASNCVSESVKEYFHYGEGSKLIHDAVKGALTSSFRRCASKIKKCKP